MPIDRSRFKYIPGKRTDPGGTPRPHLYPYHINDIYDALDGVPDGDDWANAEGAFVAGADGDQKVSVGGQVTNLKTGIRDIQTYGTAAGNGSSINTPMAAALTDAYGKRRTLPGVYSDSRGTLVITLPPGDFLISTIRGLLGTESPSVKTVGFRIKGAGSGLTNILFDPASAGEMAFNDYWLNIGVEGVSFICLEAGSDFMWSHTTHNAQYYKFRDVEWIGPWRYIFDLQGNNNNSEYVFDACGTSGIQAAGAFLRVGSTNTSDQFLNYWFYGFKHWSTHAPLIDMARGGHVHIYGLDVSDFASGAVVNRPVFILRGASHANGVESLTASGVRVEAKSTYAQLIYSEWAGGNVTIQFDFSSQMGTYTYGDIIDINLINVPGPVYKFHDSRGAGGIKVKYTASNFPYDPKIIIEGGNWHQRLTASEVVTYDETSAGGNLCRPAVVFRDVRFDAQRFSTTGRTVPDAIIGRAMGVSAPRRSFRVSSVTGGVEPGQKVNFPIGAIITGLRIVLPAGVSPETSPVGFQLKTTEGSPTTIGTVASAGNANLGYHAYTELNPPFHCSTRDKATVMTYDDPSNPVSNRPYEQALYIEGYW